MNSNDIDKGLRRVVDDLTSYYLLGYYSATAKPDGRFHAINVKVKRPGVNVRARRGYRSATRAEMESDAKAMAAAKADVSPATRVIGTLSKIRTDAFVHATAGYEWGPSAVGRASARRSGLRPSWTRMPRRARKHGERARTSPLRSRRPTSPRCRRPLRR